MCFFFQRQVMQVDISLSYINVKMHIKNINYRDAKNIKRWQPHV